MTKKNAVKKTAKKAVKKAVKKGAKKPARNKSAALLRFDPKNRKIFIPNTVVHFVFETVPNHSSSSIAFEPLTVRRLSVKKTGAGFELSLDE